FWLRMSAATLPSRSPSRARRMTWLPFEARSLAVASPIPLDEPEMTDRAPEIVIGGTVDPFFHMPAVRSGSGQRVLWSTPRRSSSNLRKHGGAGLHGGRAGDRRPARAGLQVPRRRRRGPAHHAEIAALHCRGRYTSGKRLARLHARG